MSIAFGVAVYFIIWWIVLFAVLPFGLKRTQREAGDIVPGSEPGAPERPQLLKVALWTTVISALVFAGYVWLRQSGVSLDDFPLPRPPSQR